MRFLIVLLFLPMWSIGLGQQLAGIGFYNLENFYDTVPSNDHPDHDYTPAGKYRWNSEKYETKVQNISRVLELMDLDVVVLAEVENVTVLEDLARECGLGYKAIGFASGDRRGMNYGLLYKPYSFDPLYVNTVRSKVSRNFIYLRGELYGNRIDIVVCHMPSKLNNEKYRRRAVRTLKDFTDSLTVSDVDARLVVLGDFNAVPTERTLRPIYLPAPNGDCLVNPFARLHMEGKGTYVFKGKWYLYDNIFISSHLLEGPLMFRDYGIYIRDFMLEDRSALRKGYPLRTYSGRQYTGGYSDHLPVYVRFATE